MYVKKLTNKMRESIVMNLTDILAFTQIASHNANMLFPKVVRATYINSTHIYKPTGTRV